MRNDAGMEKPSPFVPARSVPSFTEQIPTILKMVPFFQAGSRCAADCAGKTAENT